MVAVWGFGVAFRTIRFFAVAQNDRKDRQSDSDAIDATRVTIAIPSLRSLR